MIGQWGARQLTIREEATSPHQVESLKLGCSKARARLEWRRLLTLDEAALRLGWGAPGGLRRPQRGSWIPICVPETPPDALWREDAQVSGPCHGERTLLCRGGGRSFP
jgi:hypothetical protein